MWIAGDEVEPEAYNRMNEAAEGRLLPAPLMRAAGRGRTRARRLARRLARCEAPRAGPAYGSALALQSVLVYHTHWHGG